eukprot:COSAG01_NODE_730_length_14022_cov_127.417511_8_plen_85_part_00
MARPPVILQPAKADSPSIEHHRLTEQRQPLMCHNRLCVIDAVNTATYPQECFIIRNIVENHALQAGTHKPQARQPLHAFSSLLT